MNVFCILCYMRYKDKLGIKHHAMMMYGGADI